MSNSTNVETNVVQMRFDNKNFEKNIKQTTDSIDKLKKELKFEESAKSFKQLEENAKRVDFSPLSKGLEKVQASFSFLDTFSATVYHRLSNRLIDIGKKITTSVSTEGIKSGFSEYELKMNSFKTIQASAGKDFTDSQINEYLEELNRYADRTIYSFSDMTNNIGKFTNAGVKLNVAVKAIQGISNEAAVSGANAQEASRAMYNFSQALSAGYVKLIDWKSIENANMATEEFKNELIKTAVSVGKLTKAQNGMYKTQKGKLLNSTRGFNDALQDQWMTTEVLTKTLEKYADETTEIGKKAFDAAQKVNTFSKLIDTLKESIQSGWSQTWELLIGNLKEATELWTLVSDKIGGVIDAFFAEKKAILEDWKAHGGRNRMLKAMGEILKNIGTILNQIKKAWRDVFPKATVNTMMSLTESFENFASKTKVGSKTLDQIRDTFRGLFAAIMIVKDAITAFRQTFGKFFLKVLGDALHSLFGVTGSLGDMLVQVRKHIKENKTFYTVFEAIVKVLDWVYSGVKKVAGVLWDFATAVGNAIKSFGGFDSITKWFDEFFNAIKNFDILKIAELIWRLVKNIAKTIDKALEKTFDFYTPVKEKLIEVKNKIANSKIVESIINIFTGMINGIQKIINSFRDIKTEPIDDFTDKTKTKFSIFDTLVKIMQKILNAIKKTVTAIWNIAKPVITFIGKIFKTIFDEIFGIIQRSDLGDVGGLIAGGALGALLLELKRFFEGVGKIRNIAGNFKINEILTRLTGLLQNITKLIKAKTLKEIATAILMLAGAILILAMVPEDRVVSSTNAILTLFYGLSKAVKSMSNTSGKASMFSMAGITSVILGIASAMVLLSTSLALLSFINYENSAKALMVMGSILAMIVMSVNSISSAAAKGKTSAVTLISLSVLIATLASALTLLTVPIIAFSIIIAKQKNGASNLTKATAILVGILLAVSGICFAITKLVSKLKILDVIKTVGILYTFGTVFKKLSTSLTLVMGTIAAISILMSKGLITDASLEKSGEVMLAILASLTGIILIFSEISKKINSGDIVKVTALIGIVSLMVSILSGIFAIISVMPQSWIEKGIVGLSAIVTAMVTIISTFAIIAKINPFKNFNFTDLLKMLLLIGGIIVPFSASVTLLFGGLSLLIKTLSKHNVDTDIVKMAILLIASAITAIGVAWIALTKAAANIKMIDTIKTSMLITAITVLVTSLAVIITLLSTIEEEKMLRGAIGLNAIAASILLIFAALNIIVGSSEKNSIKLVNGVKFIALITLALYSLTGVLTVLTTIAHKPGFDKAVTTLLKLSALIVTISYIVGKSKAVATGINVLSKTILSLSAAAAAFGVFVLAIVKAFTLLKNLTDDDLERMENGIKKFVKTFEKTYKDLSKVIGTGIAFIIRTILNTIMITLKDSAEYLIDALINLLDILIAQAPKLVSKALELLTIILTSIAQALGPVVDAALKVAISFVNALADGISSHSDEILDAINNLIDAASGLLAKAVSRILGIKEWEAGYKTLKSIIKNIGSLLLTIFVISKLKSKADLAIRVFSSFVTKLKSVKNILKTNGFGSAWKEVLGINKLNEEWERVRLAHANGMASTKTIVANGAKAIAGAALVGAEIGLVIGTIIKGFIDAKTEAIDATKSIYEETDAAFAKIETTILDRNKSIRENLNKDREEMQKIDTKYATGDQLKKRLLDAIDSKTGKIKTGREEEAQRIADEMQDALGIRITLENNIVKLIDEQGKKRQFDLGVLEKEIKLEQFKEKLKQQQEKRADIEEERKKAIKERDELKEKEDPMYETLYTRLRKYNDEYDKIVKARENNEITEEQRRELMKPLNDSYSSLMNDIVEHSKGYFEKGENIDLKSALDYYRQAYTDTTLARQKADENIKSLTTQLQNIDDAQIAYEQGKIDDMNKFSLVFSGYYKRGLSDKQKQAETEKLTDDMANAVENIEESVYSEVKGIYDALKLYKQELGESTDELDKQWNEYEKKYSLKRGTTSNNNPKPSTKGDDDGLVTKTMDYANTKIGGTVSGGDIWDKYIKDAEKQGQTIGKARGQGEAKSYLDTVVGPYGQTKMGEAKDATIDELQNIWDFGSPSKVMEEEVGKYLGQGIMSGMETAVDSWNLTNMATGLLTKLRMAILPGIASLNGQPSTFGGITPVNFDLNQNGSSFSPMPNFPLAPSGVLPYATHLDNINNSLNRLTERMVQQTDGIISEIQMLRGDVTDLGTRVSSMEVRLDGRTLVGELTPRINDELIRYGVRVERGV